MIYYIPVISLDYFYAFYKRNELFFCGYLCPLSAIALRICVIGQNFVAFNRFTAVFFTFDHDKVEL